MSIGTLSAQWLDEGYAALIFMLGVTIIGSVAGVVIGVTSAVAAAIAFNYLVAAPRFDISYNKTTDFIPPFTFAACAIISGVMAGRLKDRTQAVQANSERMVGLLEISRDLQQASRPAEILATLRQSLLGRLGIVLGLYEVTSAGLVVVGDSNGQAPWLELAQMAYGHNRETLHRWGLSAYLLSGSEGPVGVLISDAADGSEFDDQFMMTLVGILGLALERAQLAAKVVDARATARSEEFKTALLSSVSHDMRTPLTSISTSAASLLAFGQQFDEETSQQLLGGIVAECDRLNHLTSNLLEMTRLQSGSQNLRLSVLPVVEMIRSAVVRLTSHPSGERLQFSAPRQDILIEADGALFELALTNIIQNALLYSPPDSPVVLQCRTEDGRCVIAVTDQGKGIAPDQQARVFERFYRVHSDHRTPKGTGLGLAIAQGFVEASQGTIGIESPLAGGRGTRITISLPLADLLPTEVALAATAVAS